jgi:preprotein translocase subunit SecB
MAYTPSQKVTVLIVGGGGGAYSSGSGFDGSGGGGAGGFQEIELDLDSLSGDYTVEVGAKGSKGSPGSDGSQSSAFGYTSAGGNHGKQPNGGDSGSPTIHAGGGTSDSAAGGGGGGSGGDGQDGYTQGGDIIGGDGGAGTASGITGSNIEYAGGGGGGGLNSNGSELSTPGSGGSAANYNNAGQAFDGIVVIRYNKNDVISASGGDAVYDDGEERVHEFTTTGTATFSISGSVSSTTSVSTQELTSSSFGVQVTATAFVDLLLAAQQLAVQAPLSSVDDITIGVATYNLTASTILEQFDATVLLNDSGITIDADAVREKKANTGIATTQSATQLRAQQIGANAKHDRVYAVSTVSVHVNAVALGGLPHKNTAQKLQVTAVPINGVTFWYNSLKVKEVVTGGNNDQITYFFNNSFNDGDLALHIQFNGNSTEFGSLEIPGYDQIFYGAQNDTVIYAEEDTREDQSTINTEDADPNSGDVAGIMYRITGHAGVSDSRAQYSSSMADIAPSNPHSLIVHFAGAENSSPSLGDSNIDYGSATTNVSYSSNAYLTAQHGFRVAPSSKDDLTANGSGTSAQAVIAVAPQTANTHINVFAQKLRTNSNVTYSSATLEDFEDGFSNQWVQTTNFELFNSPARGTQSAGHDTGGQPIDAIYRPFDGFERQPDKCSFYWQETSNQSGFTVQFKDGNGDSVLEVGGNNPEWELDDGDGRKTPYNESNNYGDWIYYEFTFDWQNGTYDYYMENATDNITRSGTRALIKSTGIEEMRINDSNSDFGSADHMWFDDISFSGVNVPQNQEYFGVTFREDYKVEIRNALSTHVNRPHNPHARVILNPTAAQSSQTVSAEAVGVAGAGAFTLSQVAAQQMTVVQNAFAVDASNIYSVTVTTAASEPVQLNAVLVSNDQDRIQSVQSLQLQTGQSAVQDSGGVWDTVPSAHNANDWSVKTRDDGSWSTRARDGGHGAWTTVPRDTS